MIKPMVTRQLRVLLIALFVYISPCNLAQATVFEQQELNQEEVIAVARPYSRGKYDLLIIRQIPGQKQCWSEIGANPVIIDPLLLNFDFTGSCERSTDSNGYSIRIDGEDYGLDYLLRIVERNGDLVLIGTHRVDTSRPEILVGRTNGIGQGLLKIVLNPGWRFTKRSYQGRALGHTYLTGDSKAMSSPITTTVSQNNPKSSENNQIVREYTFTAENATQPPNAATNPQNPQQWDSGNSTPPPILNTGAYPPSNTNNTTSLPPLTPTVTNSTTSLPPLTPPSTTTNNPIVPPPPPSAVNAQRRSLSEVLGSLNNTQTPTNALAQTPQLSNYRVLIEARSKNQQDQMKSLYPDAFPTNYNGRSLWQIGVFSTRTNADTALNSLTSMGLKGMVVPF